MRTIAILNFYDKEKDKNILVKAGDEVISNTSEFNLTEGRKYTIVEVYDVYEFGVITDLGVETIFSVEHFRK